MKTVELPNGYDGNMAEHIAIVGITGRFPGAANVDEFWCNLRDGIESISFFTQQELASSNLDPSLQENPQYVGADGIIKDMDLFDAAFFGYTPREAELMDPQHRLFLECAWEALENAGYDSESYDGRIGVYASANLSSYLLRNILANPELRATATSFHTMLGNDKDFVATRVSYKLNLKGPSLSVATLCSSSFVAIHLAAQSLLNYQNDLALAGSISLQASHNEAFFYQEGGIGAADGHCRAFDAQANGTVSGSGIGIVVLKRLEDALAEGDCIRAIIRGTAMNNDGAMKFSYTAPSVAGQAAVIAEALALAEVNPETITYVETHGTGTRLGDPIEIEALTRAFRAGTDKKGYCAIGSVKTNIGHLVNAGGVASLIKTILSFEHKQIPASLNFETPNPQIDFANSPFYVNTKLAKWNPHGIPRRAGVSSFGIGGTNVHMIVEEAPVVPPSGTARPWQLLIWSARTESTLNTQTSNLLTYLRQHPDSNLPDIAYTLQVGRRAFAHRRALLCRSSSEALAALQSPESAPVWTHFQESLDRPVVFMFPGARGQRLNQESDLYYNEHEFQEQVDHCTSMLPSYLQTAVKETLLAPTPPSFAPEPRGQIALFVLEYALATLWQSWGVKPRAMFGEGVGEYVAACLSGVMSLPDGLALLIDAVEYDEQNGQRQSPATPLEQISFQAPQIPYVSGVTGDWVTEQQLQSHDYWRRLLAANSSPNVTNLLTESEPVLLEIGPDSFLSKIAVQHSHKAEKQLVLSSLSEESHPSASASLLLTVAQLWLAGVRLDWNGFHNHHYRRRLPLPTYPFERQRYWVEPVLHSDGEQSVAKKQSLHVNEKSPDVSDWFYIPSWTRTVLPAVASPHTDASSWLLFVDGESLGDHLAQRLRQASLPAIVVRPGPFFAAGDDDTFMINPGEPADYERLIQELALRGVHPQKIVHMWYATADTHPADVDQDKGFYSLLFLAQALGQAGSVAKVSLFIVATNLFDVSGHDRLVPEKATILGPARVVCQEYPHIQCHFIDVVLPSSPNQGKHTLAEQLWLELQTAATASVVAYRDRYRWTQTFESISASMPANKPLLQKEGTYLLFNGLRSIGFLLSQHLIQAGATQLTLTTCEDLPARDSWHTYLNTHKQDEIGRQILNALHLEAMGGKILVVSVDETDPIQVESAVASATQQFGELNGVIFNPRHTGQVLPVFVREANRSTCEREFLLIKSSLSAVRSVIAEKNLDFCMVTSSISSVLAGPGLAIHAGISNFLDSFTQHVAQTSPYPWIVVNWDILQTAETDKIPLARPEQMQTAAITLAEGLQVAAQLFPAPYNAPQIIVSTIDLPFRLQKWTPSTQQNTPQPQALTFHPRPELAYPFAAPRNEVEEKLANIWQRAMGVKPVGIHDNFFELGGDSLLAVQIISQIREAFKIDIPLGDLFEQPTIGFLSEYIQTILWAIQGATPPTSSTHAAQREEIEL